MSFIRKARVSENFSVKRESELLRTIRFRDVMYESTPGARIDESTFAIRRRNFSVFGFIEID